MNQTAMNQTAMRQTAPGSQGGFSLLELMIVVSVIGILAAGAYALAPNLISNVGATNEIKKVEAISQNILGVYDKASNFGSLDQSNAVDLKVFPEGMEDGGSVYNRWNGSVTVASAADLQGNANRAFTIEVDGIPSDACAEMASGMAGAAQVQVDGTTVYQANDTDLDIGLVGSQCTSDSNTVTYLYEKR